jgi:hypothetical protein
MHESNDDNDYLGVYPSTLPGYVYVPHHQITVFPLNNTIFLTFNNHY